jgi:glyoxylase-like metal-dependent hydrolase (beta-lactamase superfamily II)
MGKNSFSFKLGDLECLVVSDGSFTNRYDKIFSNVPPGQLEPLLRKYNYPLGDLPTSIACLLIRKGGKNFLIDTGWGIGIEPNAGKLLENLRAEGIPPAEIDAVIISHAHPDHIGGITDDKGNIAFPKARYILNREEAEFWLSNPDLTKVRAEESVKQGMLKAVQKNLQPVKDRLTLVDHDTVFEPGVKLVKTPGHTPTHSVIIVASGNEQILYTADLILYPFQLERLDLYPVFDFVAEQAYATRKKIISWLASEQMLVLACHFPFPGIGHIVEENGSWRWQPIKLPA